MKFIRVFGIAFTLISIQASAQVIQNPDGGTTTSDGRGANAITTAVPFLLISPDARSGALGEAGVALSTDPNATFWNPSKLAFVEQNDGLSVSYSPWLKNLVSDVNLGYLSYFHRLDERNTLGASVRYFSLGSIELIDASQNVQGQYNPNEFSVDATFARKFGENFSLGTSLRFIHSNLLNGASSGQQTKAGNAVAADVSMTYKSETQQFGKDALFAFGANISNIGTKISYSDGGPKYFLPTNLKIGAANTWFLDDFNQLTLTLDLNKLLVPTPPIRDTEGNIVSGKEDDRTVVSGIFGSFSDAPGGFSEELKEINLGGGMEYWYNKTFALRLGYFYENPDKGNRKYLTLGAGFRYKFANIDFAYLVANQQSSPLANTLRFSLLFNFGADAASTTAPASGK
ncbi:MAG: type IX secretion system outer membrane channel protein PorV [Mucilaginibacter polytrichastri]|nr:type IX secretion system outer membrane channel protein PorV [Mucilaginibacter polytrichastri]